MKLEHVALNVEAPQEMADWYARHLGMRIVRADAESPFIRFLADKAGSMIELYKHPSVKVPDYSSIDPLVLHLAYEVDEVEATRDKLLAAGASGATEVTVTPLGDKMLFLRDPWQVPLQLVKRKKPLV